MLQTEYIQVNGLSYHIQRKVIDHKLPTIVFLHDSLGCVKLWRDFPEKLGNQSNCNILIYDREGHGKSSPFSITERSKNYLEEGADTLQEIIELLNLNQIILFGHSDGATISLWYAAKYPKFVIATIVEGVHVFVEEETLQGIREAKKAVETSNLTERVAKYHGEKTEMLFKLWMETWLNLNYRDWNIEHDIQAISSPVLVFQGENDEFGTVKQVEKIKKNVTSNVIDFLIPDCGHSPHKEQTEFILQQSTLFIAQVINDHETI